jgi:hypothetical protein
MHVAARSVQCRRSARLGLVGTSSASGAIGGHSAVAARSGARVGRFGHVGLGPG